MSLEPLLLKRGDIKEDTDLVGNGRGDGRGENELNCMERGERKRMCCVACKILHPNLLTPYYRSLHCTLLTPLTFTFSSLWTSTEFGRSRRNCKFPSEQGRRDGFFFFCFVYNGVNTGSKSSWLTIIHTCSFIHEYGLNYTLIMDGFFLDL